MRGNYNNRNLKWKTIHCGSISLQKEWINQKWLLKQYVTRESIIKMFS